MPYEYRNFATTFTRVVKIRCHQWRSTPSQKQAPTLSTLITHLLFRGPLSFGECQHSTLRPRNLEPPKLQSLKHLLGIILPTRLLQLPQILNPVARQRILHPIRIILENIGQKQALGFGQLLQCALQGVDCVLGGLFVGGEGELSHRVEP